MKKFSAFLLISLITLSVFPQKNSNSRIPMLGEKAPSFNAKSTMGEISFPKDYFGKWKILFSHPASFTPVCTTEILELALLQDDFDKLNTALIILSTDGLNSHIEWVNSMESINYKDHKNIEINFPIIADAGYDVSRKYGMMHPESNSTLAVRAVFIIDPEDNIRAILYYPFNVGRNINEIMRTTVALQEVEKKDILTPANWNLGDDYLVGSPESLKEAEKLREKNDPSMYSLAWYMWYKKVK